MFSGIRFSGQLFLLRGGAGQAVEGGPVGLVKAFDDAFRPTAGGVDQGIEGGDNNQGQNCGQCQAEDEMSRGQISYYGETGDVHEITT